MADMSDVDEWDLAQAMIRLYGRKAEHMAQDHADTFASKGNQADSKKWRRVKDIVTGLRAGSPSRKTRH
jgi:hypothetical protein